MSSSRKHHSRSRVSQVAQRTVPQQSSSQPIYVDDSYYQYESQPFPDAPMQSRDAIPYGSARTRTTTTDNDRVAFGYYTHGPVPSSLRANEAYASDAVPRTYPSSQVQAYEEVYTAPPSVYSPKRDAGYSYHSQPFDDDYVGPWGSDARPPLATQSARTDSSDDARRRDRRGGGLRDEKSRHTSSRSQSRRPPPPPPRCEVSESSARDQAQYSNLYPSSCTIPDEQVSSPYYASSVAETPAKSSRSQRRDMRRTQSDTLQQSSKSNTALLVPATTSGPVVAASRNPKNGTKANAPTSVSQASYSSREYRDRQAALHGGGLALRPKDQHRPAPHALGSGTFHERSRSNVRGSLLPKHTDPDNKHAKRNTVLGGLGGAALGTLLFPGVGTLVGPAIGGALMGSIGGHEAGKGDTRWKKKRELKKRELKKREKAARRTNVEDDESE